MSENLYKYYSLRRPVDIGTCPSGFIKKENYGSRKSVMNHTASAWGEVVYNRKLTEKEIYDYELLEEVSRKEMQEDDEWEEEQ